MLKPMDKRIWALGFVLSITTGCTVTQHSAVPARLGVASRSAQLEAIVDQPGPLTVESIVSARWEVDLSGLVNLEHPKAKAAHLSDRTEPIDLYVHVLRHPKYGTFLIDSGVEHAFVADPKHALLHGMLASLAHVDRLKVLHDMRSIVADAGPISGVLLTHLHADHILGLRDVPASAPIYVGPGDTEERSFMNLLMRGVFDHALAEKAPLRVLQFKHESQGTFDGVLDVFGDGSLWAIWAPGHTPGSVAYLARTAQGPVLFTGDVSHTSWGWKHGVEPGTFSDDRAQSAASFAKLQRFAARHPGLDVRLGHQAFAAAE